MTDGRYCTLDQFKQYVIGTRTNPLNPTEFNGAVSGTPDDDILSRAILDAENYFGQFTGTYYDQDTMTLVQPVQCFVDGYGWLNLYARERAPVTAVSAIRLRDLLVPSRGWVDVGFTSDNLVLPPYAVGDTAPHPQSWHVQVYPTSPVAMRSVGEVMMQWTYTGGFATIPPALTMLISQMALFVYKFREMPTSKVIDASQGVMEMPTNFPPSIKSQMQLWCPVYG